MHVGDGVVLPLFSRFSVYACFLHIYIYIHTNFNTLFFFSILIALLFHLNLPPTIFN